MLSFNELLNAVRDAKNKLENKETKIDDDTIIELYIPSDIKILTVPGTIRNCVKFPEGYSFEIQIDHIITFWSLEDLLQLDCKLYIITSVHINRNFQLLEVLKYKI